MMQDIVLGDRRVGPSHPPLVIAEMSGNHNQSLDRALAIVDAAADAGAHAIKLQTYTADTMTLDVDSKEFRIDDDGSLWEGRSLYDLYEEAHTPWEWHQPIMERCKKHGMVAFSTPFDDTAIEFLESLDVPCYKIASFENTDLSLIRAVAALGKPVIISTGICEVAEIDEAVRTARGAGCDDLILLKCTSSYPASPEDSNLRTIPHLREMFGVQVGLSDHTMGVGASVAAIAMGATLVEKHFTHSRAEGGVDSAFSLEPPELQSLVVETERAWRALGRVTYGPTAEEKRSVRFRRSLYVTRDMKAGEAFTQENLRSIRPGFGLAPRYYGTLLGKRVNRAVSKGTPVTWDLLG